MTNIEKEFKNVPAFQEEVCKKTCILKGACILDPNKDNHWYVMCPLYFNWKLNYSNWIIDQLRREREHPEEAEEQYKKNVRIANKIREERKKERKMKNKDLLNVES